MALLGESASITIIVIAAKGIGVPSAEFSDAVSFSGFPRACWRRGWHGSCSCGTALFMDPGLSPSSVVVASSEQVSCPLGEESAILNLKNSVYYGLNEVGARVWNLVQQPRSIAEVRDAIAEEYEVEPGRCEREIIDIVQKLKDEGLVELKGTAAL
jgi:hypothetical protein